MASIEPKKESAAVVSLAAHGMRDHPSAILGLREEGSVLHEFLQRDKTLSLWVPSEFVGKIIGKAGTVISSIRKEHQVIVNGPPPSIESLWVDFTIIGEWKNIRTAYKAISDIVQGEVDDVVLSLSLRRKPFFLYGRTKIPIIKTVSATANVRIYLPETNVNDPSYVDGERMTLEGTFENVCRAVELLEKEAVAYKEQQAQKKLAATATAVVTGAQSDDTKRERLREQSSHAPSVPPVNSLKDLNKEKRDKDRQRETIVLKKPIVTQEEKPDTTIANAIKTTNRVVESHQKSIQISQSLTKLLQAKRPQAVFTQFEKFLFVKIARVGEDSSSMNSQAPAIKRSVSGEESQSAVSNRDRDCDDAEDSDDSSHFQDTQEAPAHVFADLPEPASGVAAPSVPAKPVNELLTFRISGEKLENVEACHRYLERIIKGEPIKKVLDHVRNSTSSTGAPHASGFLKSSAGGPRKPAPAPAAVTNVHAARNDSSLPKDRAVDANEGADMGTAAAVAPTASTSAIALADRTQNFKDRKNFSSRNSQSAVDKTSDGPLQLSETGGHTVNDERETFGGKRETNKFESRPGRGYSGHRGPPARPLSERPHSGSTIGGSNSNYSMSSKGATGSTFQKKESAGATRTTQPRTGPARSEVSATPST